MKIYFAISSILLTATVASGFPSPNERFSAALTKIKSIQSSLEYDRARARQNKDPILFSCLNDASRQIYATTKLLEGRYSNPSDHDAIIAEEILSRVSNIHSQASLCLGSPQLSSNSPSQSSSSIDSSIPNINPDISTPPLAIEPPNCASCFR